MAQAQGSRSYFPALTQISCRDRTHTNARQLSNKKGSTRFHAKMNGPDGECYCSSVSGEMGVVDTRLLM